MPHDLLGKYRLGEQIARGGMAEIYHAQVVGASGFAREIVVKRILPDLVEDQEFREMFEDEAKLAARLEHPNIVQIFDFDQVGDSFYIAMEYVRGADFAKLIRAAAERSERLPPEVVVFIVSEVLEGLRHAHALKDEEGHPLGLIHRDISPANVLLSYAGAVKLADFGIAKAATSIVRTSAGILKGKYPYMSPEQASGKALDNRSDLFSVGIVLYQALTGRRPFRGKDSVEILEHVMAGKYPPASSVAPNIPPELEAIVDKALTVDLASRYRDADEFLVDLRAAFPRSPARDDVEQCLRRLIPEKPRTLSRPNPGGDLAPTMRALSGSSNFPTPKTFETGPTTREPIPPTVASEVRRAGISGLVGGGVVVAVLALGLAIWLGLGTPGLGGGGGGGRAAEGDAAASATTKTFTVLMRRSPDQEQELRRHGLDEALESRGLKLRILRYEEYDELFRRLRDSQVDLASVPLAAAKALAREDLVIPAGRLAGDELDAMRARFTTPAIEVATVDSALGSDMAFLPEQLEVHLLAYRVSKVELAAERWTKHRADIDAALREVNHRGLPEGYDLEGDPWQWDEFDVFVAGWTWAHEDHDGTAPAPRLALRSQSYWPSVEGLLDRAAHHGEDRVTWARQQSLMDVITWLVLHREHGLQRAEVWDATSGARANGTSIGQWFARGEIYLARVNQFRVSELGSMLADGRHGFDVSDIAFAPCPAGSSALLDESGAPVRAGRHDGLVNAWLWAIPSTAADPATSLAVSLDLTSQPVQLYFATRNCWIPTLEGVDVTESNGDVPPHCRRAIAPGTERLSRRLLTMSLPEVTRLTEIVAQHERLWDELFVRRGYAPEGGTGVDPARITEVVYRHLPEE